MVLPLVLTDRLTRLIALPLVFKRKISDRQMGWTDLSLAAYANGSTGQTDSTDCITFKLTDRRTRLIVSPRVPAE